MATQTKHFLSYIESTIKKYWDSPALSDYDTSVNFTYGEMAKEISRIHSLFEAIGINKGDKIALCGRNSSRWAISFLAITSYEATAVSILPEFDAESIHSLINHSDTKLFFAGPAVWAAIDPEKMPNLIGIISIEDFELKISRSDILSYAHANLDTLFSKKYVNGFSEKDIAYPTDNFDKPALINYTSGTTSDPKGVILSYLSLSSNVQFGQDRIPNQPGWSMVSMLPLAHMFGLTFEFLYQLAGGCHVYFLNRTPSPQILMKSFSEVHPYMILTVPLVIEKVFKNTVFPVIHRPMMRVLWAIPGINRIIRNKVRAKLMSAFGGELRHLIIGGAALNKKVESCMKQIHFPYTVGYGMTECGPILGYEDWTHFKKKSCGKIVDRMEVTIDSSNPRKVVGEIMVRGENVMMGYYKNPDATEAVLKDGWLRTGDLGVVDSDGNIFIRGRNKSMILGASGQNIYPEEIEDKLNNMAHVVESLVLERKGKLEALVFADIDSIKKELNGKKLEELFEQYRVKLNRMIPTFCRINRIQLVSKEFEKTPKRSIKRFLYK